MWTREDLLDSLRGLGLLWNRSVERAVRDVDQEAFLPEEFRALAYADMPLPVLRTLRGPTMPSARCLVAALELLEPTEDLRYLVCGARGGYAAALLAALADPERVAVAEGDAERRATTARRLEAAGLDGVRVLPAAPEGETFDRILVLDASVPRPRELSAHLAEMGFLVARGRGVEDLAFVKIVRSSGESVHMTIGEAPAPAAGPRPAKGTARIDFARLFAVEDLLLHAWEGRVVGHYDQHFQDIVDETFADGPLDLEAFDPGAEPERLAARRAFQAAYILQSAGELERAGDAYERSLRLARSAEAHTFLGWTCSFMGDYARAIEECEAAIRVDPTFGNPYNDIGAYLIELGKLDDAIPWLEKALVAPRYCCYFYAHANLARAFLQQGMRERARKHLRAALDLNPEYEPARELLRRLDVQDGYFG